MRAGVGKHDGVVGKLPRQRLRQLARMDLADEMGDPLRL